MKKVLNDIGYKIVFIVGVIFTFTYPFYSDNKAIYKSIIIILFSIFIILINDAPKKTITILEDVNKSILDKIIKITITCAYVACQIIPFVTLALYAIDIGFL